MDIHRRHTSIHGSSPSRQPIYHNSCRSQDLTCRQPLSSFIIIGTNTTNDFKKEQEDIISHLSPVHKDPASEREACELGLTGFQHFIPSGTTLFTRHCRSTGSQGELMTPPCRPRQTSRSAHSHQNPTTFFPHLSTILVVEEPWINITRFLLLCCYGNKSQPTPLSSDIRPQQTLQPKETGDKHQSDQQDLFFH